MTLDEFKTAREQDLEGALLALWWDAHGDWDRAHEVAQEIEDARGSWVHAYLHRKEGDQGNAPTGTGVRDGVRRKGISIRSGLQL